jgi:hypothetical protein
VASAVPAFTAAFPAARLASVDIELAAPGKYRAGAIERFTDRLEDGDDFGLLPS